MKHVKSKKESELLGQILLWVLLIGALLVFSVPFFFMISNSFEEFSYVLPYPPRLLPDQTGLFRVSAYSGAGDFPDGGLEQRRQYLCNGRSFRVHLHALGLRLRPHPVSGPGQALWNLSVYADDAGLSEHHTAVPDLEGHSASGPDKRPDWDACRSDPGVCGDQRLRAYVFFCGISSGACRILCPNRSLSTAADTARSFSKSCCPFPNRRSGL